MSNIFQRAMKATVGKVLNKSLDVFGNTMKKTSLTFQYQSSLASYGILWLSTIFLFGYQMYTIFTNFSWWAVFYAINAFCGIMIIYSMLVSTFMSYLQIKAAAMMNDLFTALQTPGENNV